MAKLLLIGLAVAALGIGGIALPSKHDDNNASAPSAAFVDPELAAPAAHAAVASAVLGPFDRSAALCADDTYMCTALDRSGTIAEMLPRPESWERVKALNGWRDGEVTPNTVVPARTWIVFNKKLH